jgi:hypothetical protein
MCALSFINAQSPMTLPSTSRGYLVVIFVMLLFTRLPQPEPPGDLFIQTLYSVLMVL